jgi:hypothetical protein
MKDNRAELLERANLSRTRLASSELCASGQAWKLWSACIGETIDHLRAGAQTYAATLAHAARIDRTDTGRLLRRFDELGIVGWKAAPRASKGISVLTLPRDVMPQPARDGADVMPQPAHSSTEVESVELRTQYSLIGAGADHSPLIGPSDSREVERLGSLPDPSETGAPEEIRPARCTTPGCGGVVFSEGLCIDCDRERFYEAERFAPFHGDERTGDTTGDDEASQLRWQGANPRKVRARRRRD